MLIFNISSNDSLKYYSLLDSIPLQENILYKDDKLVHMVKQKNKINKPLYNMQLKPNIEIKAQSTWKENLNLDQRCMLEKHLYYSLEDNHRYSFKKLPI